MKTPNTDRLLAELVHPISPRMMRNVVYQLIRDRAFSQARELAGLMVSFGHRADGDEDFYYWLGVSQMLRALNEGAMDRWSQRAQRAHKRTLAIADAAIARAGNGAA